MPIKRDIRQAKAVKELTPTQSIKLVKELLKGNRKTLKTSDFHPGTILMYNYNAKDKKETYDRTPLVLVLWRNKSHTMAINLHWAPMPLRIILVKKIMKVNRKNIIAGKKLEFDYKALKPFLKRAGFAPIIRLYINSRISNSGVVIPNDQFMNVARTKSESFTQGRESAESLYKKALSRNKKYRSTRKRRE